jgi:hemolysin activation/secretion protein
MKQQMKKGNPSTCVRRLAVMFVLLAAYAFTTGAFAAPQSDPSTLQNAAQRLQRYYKQQQKKPLQKPSDPLQQEKPKSDDAHQGKSHAQMHFVLKRVEFSPSVLLSKQALQAAVKPYLNRSVTRADLDTMLDRINALYTEQHITTARALLRGQTIVDGVIHVDLVEGKLGKITIKGARHVHDSFIRRRIDQKKGEVVDSNRLRKNLVYLNRTTDLQVRALLAPGAKRGQTDIRLAVEEPHRHTLGVFFDNGGVDSTGRYRLGVQGHLYGLLGIDDRLDGNIAHSRGGNDGSISYSIPLFPNNGRLGVTFAHSQINILDRAFRNLDITGTSDVKSLNYRQPFLATMYWQFTGVAAYSITNSTTTVSGKQIADTTNHSETLGLSLDHRSAGQRWSVTQLVTRLDSNEPMLGKTSFTLTPGNAFFIQRLGKSKWALRVDAGWQFSSGKNVPSANLFQIGGLGSVRGYERGVLAGARGYYTDFEVHRSFDERLDLFGFVDHGTVRSHYPDSASISGAGLGGSYQRGWFSVTADVAKPFNTVTPDQDSMRFDFRLSAHFN